MNLKNKRAYARRCGFGEPSRGEEEEIGRDEEEPLDEDEVTEREHMMDDEDNEY
jgi:hypothetical protein